MTWYTLVAYRPDHTSYSRGCLMGSSSSDLKTFYSIDREAIIRQIEVLMAANEGDDDFGTYEFVVVVDGYPVGSDENPQWIGQHPEEFPVNSEVEGETIIAKARENHRKNTDARQKERERLVKLEIERQKKKAEAEREKLDRAEFERLRKKFEAT